MKLAWRVAKRSVQDMLVDNGPQWAAAIAYYSLLSLFPLLVAAASIASFFVDPDWAISQVTALLGDFLPGGEEQIDEIVQNALDARGTVTVVSLVSLLWSGTRVFGTLARALNIAFDVDDTYGFLQRTFIEAVMLLTVGGVFVLALVTPYALSTLATVLEDLPESREVVFRALELGVPALFLFTAFLIGYRFIPRSKPSWRSALAGALVATPMVLTARPIFLYYIGQFSDYNLVYGSIAVVVVLILWAWIVSLIALFGGEIASHYQAIVIGRQTDEEVEQSHRLRSGKRTAEEARPGKPEQPSPARSPSRKWRAAGLVGVTGFVGFLAGAFLFRRS